MRASHRIMLWVGGIFCLVILANPLFSQSYSLQGRVYSGNTGLEPPNSTPIPNVPVILWGANTSGVKVSPPIDNTTTDGSGWYSLDVDIMVDAFDFYIIEEVDLSGYYSVGATTVGGSKLSDNLIEYTFMELTGGDKTGNKFWDKPNIPENTPPTADADGPYTGTVGQSITLDGSGSFDPDAGDSIVSYAWDLDGDGQYDDETGMKPHHTWHNPFTGSIRLQVTDTHGAADSDGANVTITEADQDEYDFGDAPASYGNTWHIPCAVWLGGQTDIPPDTEHGTRADSLALGDDNDGNDDENGIADLTELNLTAGKPATIHLTVHSEAPAEKFIVVAGWIDFDADGLFDQYFEDIGEQMDYISFGSTMIFEFSFNIPADATIGTSYAHFRLWVFDMAGLNSGKPLPNTGFGGYGEVEDYKVAIEKPQYEWDFGDAPEIPERGYNYPTTLANNGARHKITRYGPWLGSASFNYSRPDAEPDGQPDLDAKGDNQTDHCDECSCVSNYLFIGLPNTIDISVGSGGIVDVWVDLNQDGRWQHPAEQIFSGFLPEGFHKVSVAIPDSSVPGSTYIRVRISTAGGLTPEGPADDGEVVDEKMIIYQADFGDLPDSYKFYYESGLPINEEVALLGNTVDGELKSQPNLLADGDDINGIDDEDGVRFLTPLIPGKNALVEVVCTSKPNTVCEINGYLDFHGDGHFDTYDKLFWFGHFTPDSQSVYVKQFTVPTFLGEGIHPVVKGPTYARFRIMSRIASSPSLYWGEIEDYRVIIGDSTDSALRDYGDAPASYGEAWHKLGGPWFGKLNDCPDSEPSAQFDSQALGDDQDGNDDEDGLVYVNMVSGQQHGMIYFDIIPGPSGDVSIASWVDLNADGKWMDPGESMGTIHFTFGPMPSNGWKHHYTCWWQLGDFTQAKPGKTIMRLRIVEGLKGTLSADGEEASGEVEDHEVEIRADGNPVPPGGVIFGTKWNDRNGDRFWDTNEPVLPDWEIWLDANHNGIEDPGDRYEITNASGEFAFYGLSAGQYTVGEKMKPGWNQTWPGGSNKHIVTVDPAKPGLGILFGNRESEPDTGIGAVKWSQPPLYDLKSTDTTCYRGWRELSGLTDTYLADDWFCCDVHPLTSIRWWGSYSEWDSLFSPPEGPQYFQIGIWTDVPRDSAADFSHPREMIREWLISRHSVHETIDKMHFHPESMEKPITCFRYTFYIPQNDWYYQEGDSGIYWLSIKAIYSETDPEHAWGWLTREHYFDDDAVRTLHPLEPNTGSFFETGVPIAEFQDLAFELGTDEFEGSYDFGDAPDIGYGTIIGKNGPQHLFSPDIYLGESIDTEPNGQPDMNARGDDTDSGPDEDGIRFLNDLIPGEMTGIEATVSTSGFINVWIDFNRDSTWSQPEDHVLTDAPVSSGTHLMEFLVDELARSGESFARFRFSTWPGVWVRGFAVNGEVEDYRVFIGQATAVGQSPEIPAEYRLYDNKPNPFNPETTFRFEIPFTGKEKVQVEFRIYNLRGQLIRTLIREERLPGIYETRWKGLDDTGNPVSTGIYMYCLRAGKFIATKKLILMK